MAESWQTRLIGRRGQRRLPGSWDWLPPALLGLIARRRRAAGFYDALTLTLFRRAWRSCPSPRRLFDYLSFRRDLGGVVPANRVPELEHAIPRLSGVRRRLAVAMLVESAPTQLARLSAHALAPAAACLPGVAGKRGGQGALAHIDRCQDEWRAAFAATVGGCRSVCVVGNGGMLLGARMGEFIDSHDLVVRFNVFRAPHTDLRDSGSRLDVWVVAPNLSLPPPSDARWVVVTGPDVRYRLQNWGWLLPHRQRNGAILTVPLEVWQGLALRLSAPPSAGVLFLEWLRRLRGDWAGVSAVGFGNAVGQPYHHAVPRRPAVSRHHWEAERVLLQRWRSEGLRLA